MSLFLFRPILNKVRGVDVEAAHEVLTKYLRANGKLRATPERFAVLDAVLQSQGHFDAENLYYRMIRQTPGPGEGS